MKIGDKVLYQGQVATVVNEVRPRCRCKGHGYYELHLEEGNYRKKVSLSTILEPFRPLEMTKQKLEVHKLV